VGSNPTPRIVLLVIFYLEYSDYVVSKNALVLLRDKKEALEETQDSV
jgi:hypothetical protein